MGRTLRCHRTRAARGFAAAPGFTLMESTLAVVIVAFGFLATMELFATCTTENHRSGQMTTAQMLTTNVQELTTGLAFKDPYYATAKIGAEPGESQASYNDVDDFDGFVSSPPIDATRAPIPELAQYTQYVQVMAIDPNRPGANHNYQTPELPLGTYTGAVRVRVVIEYRRTPKDAPVEVLRTSWVRLDD